MASQIENSLLINIPIYSDEHTKINSGADANSVVVAREQTDMTLLQAVQSQQWIHSQLIQPWVDVNATFTEGEHKGTTALWWAAFHKERAMIESLIKAKADVNATAANGKYEGTSALWWTTFHQQWDMIEPLIKAKADVNATAEGIQEGITALYWAAFHKEWGMIEPLIKAKADVNATAKRLDKGTTALWWAAFHKEGGMIEPLIKAKADVNATAANGGDAGTTPLWWAAFHKQWDMVTQLIKAGASIEATAARGDYKGISAVQLIRLKPRAKISSPASRPPLVLTLDTQTSVSSSPPIEKSKKKKKRIIRTKLAEPAVAIQSMVEVKVQAEKENINIAQLFISIRDRHIEQDKTIRTLITSIRHTLAQAIAALSHHCNVPEKHNRRLSRLKEYEREIQDWEIRIELITQLLEQQEHLNQQTDNQAQIGSNQHKLNLDIHYLDGLLSDIQKRMKRDNEGVKKRKKPPLILTPKETLEATFAEFHTLMNALATSTVWRLALHWNPIAEAPLPLPSPTAIIEETLPQESELNMEEPPLGSKAAAEELPTLMVNMIIDAVPLKPRGKKNRDAAFYKRKHDEEIIKQRKHEESRQKEELEFANQGFAEARTVTPLERGPGLLTSFESKRQREGLASAMPRKGAGTTTSFPLATQREVELAELREVIRLVAGLSMHYRLKACALLGAIVRVCDLVSETYQTTGKQFCDMAMHIKKGSYLRYASLRAEADYDAILDIATHWEVLVLQYLKQQTFTDELLAAQSPALVSLASLGASWVMTSDKRLPVNFCPIESQTQIQTAVTHLHECWQSSGNELTNWIYQWCCGVIGKELRALSLAKKSNPAARRVYQNIHTIIGKPGVDSILQAGAVARHPIPRIGDDGCSTSAMFNIAKLKAGLETTSSRASTVRMGSP